MNMFPTKRSEIIEKLINFSEKELSSYSKIEILTTVLLIKMFLNLSLFKNEVYK